MRMEQLDEKKYQSGVVKTPTINKNMFRAFYQDPAETKTKPVVSDYRLYRPKF